MRVPNYVVPIRVVQTLMHQQQLNVRDLATRAELDPGTVGDFLAGHRWPRIATLGKIESALGLNPGDLQAFADERLQPDIYLMLKPPIVVETEDVGPDDDAGYVADPTGPPALSQISDDELADRIRAGLEAMDEMRRRTERRAGPVEGA